MTSFGATAPANLLLLGEYAVLEEGGLGIAIAADVRGSARFSASRTIEREVSVEGIMDQQRVFWSSSAERRSGPERDKKLEAMARHLRSQFGTPTGTITIDTRPLFRADGRKRGYGSSAVTAALLTALWCRATRDNPAAPDGSSLITVGVAAHRAAQSGRGSGYDVASSLVGGTILFTGGHAPAAAPVSLPWLTDLFLFAGSAPVPTPGAVGRYETWKREHPALATQFLETSNALVSSFVSAGTRAAAAEIMERYASVTQELGERIGVPTKITAPVGTPVGIPRKAIGAGNELGIAWPQEHHGALGAISGFEPVPIASEGLVWQ
ncbi:MAG: hypothetical protein ACLFP4_07025 [Spirochaetales bacterium]